MRDRGGPEVKSTLNSLLRWERVPAAKLGGALAPGACAQMATVPMLPVCAAGNQAMFSLEQGILPGLRSWAGLGILVALLETLNK